ncbi:imidazole glycerol phosphate synthase subunit HisH [Spirochaetota bacterium]
MITVIDYGMGNLRSVVKAVELYTDKVRVSSDPASVESSDALIMPGDGAFKMAMDNLEKMGWIEPLKRFIINNGFFFGICLGFQLLFSSSQEFGDSEGLGIIDGRIVKFSLTDMKVPHMGWNSVEFVGKSAFLGDVPADNHFYFIHSYYPELNDETWMVGQADYGVKFPCIVGKGNLIATQFHPEKSHEHGLKIIENFVGSVC